MLRAPYIVRFELHKLLPNAAARPAAVWHMMQVVRFYRGDESSIEYPFAIEPPSGPAERLGGIRTLAEVERDHITRVVRGLEDRHTYGEIADALGTSKKTLWEKRKKYNL